MISPNDSAFPRPTASLPNDQYEYGEPGMSVRLWLAAKADIADFHLSDLDAERLVGMKKPVDGGVELLTWALDVEAALRLLAADRLLKAYNETP